MNTKLREKLFREADKVLAKLFPESALLHLENFPSTWRVWELNRGNGFKMFLIIGPEEKRDSFALEIAWSVNGKLPESNGRHPDEDQQSEGICFRLSRLWKRHGFEERWYLGSARGPQEIMIPAPDESFEIKMQSVAPQIKDAFAKLNQYGLPYLQQIAAKYEVELKASV